MDVTLTLAELAEELCDPRPHREPIQEWTASRNRKTVGFHITMRPGLLVELHQAVRPLLAGLSEGGTHSPPRSTPPLQLEALDRYIDIEVHAATWVEDAGLRVRLQPESNIRALVGTANALGDRAQQLLADMRRWRSWAATLAGWQSIYTPRAACPVSDCGERGTLRVNLLTQTAVCSACRSWWGKDTIGLLADHIRAEEPTSRPRLRAGVAGHGGWSTRDAPSVTPS